MLKYPQVETGFLARFYDWASKTFGAALHRQAFKKEEQPLTLEGLVTKVLKGVEEEVGYRNTDVQRMEFRIGAFNSGSPDLADLFRQYGIPLPTDVSGISAWARSFKLAERPPAQNPTTGLFDEQFRTQAGDLRGIPTPIKNTQL